MAHINKSRDGRAFIKNARGFIIWSGPQDKANAAAKRIREQSKKEEQRRVAERLARATDTQLA